MHASDWNTWAACMWKGFMQDCKQMARMWAGKRLRASGKNACTMSHPEDTPKLIREHPINIEEVNSKSKLKSRLVHFWASSTFVKRSKIICSVKHFFTPAVGMHLDVIYVLKSDK
jgi:hypothetical protein